MRNMRKVWVSWHCEHLYHVHNILHKYLYMKKLQAQWVFHLLMDNQKHTKMNIFQDYMDMFKHNNIKFLQLLITVDKTWIHYNSERQNSSPDNDGSRRECAKEGKNCFTKPKMITSVFWSFTWCDPHRLFRKRQNHAMQQCWSDRIAHKTNIHI